MIMAINFGCSNDNPIEPVIKDNPNTAENIFVAIINVNQIYENKSNELVNNWVSTYSGQNFDSGLQEFQTLSYFPSEFEMIVSGFCSSIPGSSCDITYQIWNVIEKPSLIYSNYQSLNYMNNSYTLNLGNYPGFDPNGSYAWRILINPN